MRAGMLAVAMLTAGLASGALAQQTLDETRPPPQQRATRQTQTPQTTVGEQLKAYAATLQEIEGNLRQARDKAASSPAQQTQQGAMSQPHADLLQAIRSAWQGMQAVPPSLFDSEVYKQAERRMQADANQARPTWEPNRQQGTAAADDALQTLAGLRQEVLQMASQPGANAPAPPASSGGWGTR
jgi:uncharacterized protein YdbL (DUF1318 family)